MNPEFMGDLVVGLGFMCVFLFILCLGGLVADYVFPHIPFIQRWLDSLPEYEDDEDVIREYEEIRRWKRESRRAKMKRMKRWFM